MIHLAVIHTALPWVYIIILGMKYSIGNACFIPTFSFILAITGIIGIFGLIASLSVSLLLLYSLYFNVNLLLNNAFNREVMGLWSCTK